MAAVGIFSPLDYFRNPYQLINFRNGGLGIYGGIAGGALGLFLYSRRARIPMMGWADLAVVGLALGQVFGRWGNFFNQELYGRPSDLPWAVHIDPAYRLPEYSDVSRFHPAFLYESLWSLLTFFVLYTLAKRYSNRLLTGELTALYLIFYAVGRSLLEHGAPRQPHGDHWCDQDQHGHCHPGFHHHRRCCRGLGHLSPCCAVIAPKPRSAQDLRVRSGSID